MNGGHVVLHQCDGVSGSGGGLKLAHGFSLSNGFANFSLCSAGEGGGMACPDASLIAGRLHFWRCEARSRGHTLRAWRSSVER